MLLTKLTKNFKEKEETLETTNEKVKEEVSQNKNLFSRIVLWLKTINK